MRIDEPDEWVTIRKTTKVLAMERAFPLWRLLEMPAEYLKQEVERMARDLGYASFRQNADRYGMPVVTVRFRIEQSARVTEGDS